MDALLDTTENIQRSLEEIEILLSEDPEAPELQQVLVFVISQWLRWLPLTGNIVDFCFARCTSIVAFLFQISN